VRAYSIVLIFLLIVGCASKPHVGAHPPPSDIILLERSSTTKPIWIHELQAETENDLYFVGEGEDPERESAEGEARMDALREYALYLGADIKVLESVHREEIKRAQDEIYRTEGRAVTDVEALITIYSAGFRFTDRYWEEWRDEEGRIFCKYYVLGRISKVFAEKERERIAEEPKTFCTHMRDDFCNSDLTASLRTGKDKYCAGDEVVVYFGANDRCYAYLLDCYGDGQVVNIMEGGSFEIEVSGVEYELTATAEYVRTEMGEILKLVVADTPLDIEWALHYVYPGDIIESLRAQAGELEARYAEKCVEFFITESK